MSGNLHHQLDEELIDQRDMGSASYIDHKRAATLAKVLHLLDNVAPEDKTPLITSKIKKQGFEKFDLAKSLVEGDTYYRYFLSNLDSAQLDRLLSDIRRPLDQKVVLRPKTQTAFDHVFKSTPMTSTDNAVKQAVDAFGNFFATTLKDEHRRQYMQANREFPERALEHQELNNCGKPTKGIFLKFLPKIKDPEKQLKFNRIIRKTLTNESLSTYQVQLQLLYAASKLADLLEQEGEVEAANEIHLLLKDAGFNAKRTVSPKQVKSITEKSLDRIARFLAGLKQSLKQRPSRYKKQDASGVKPRVGPKAAPVPTQKVSQESAQTARQLHELSQRIAELQAKLKNRPGAPEVVPTQSKGLTFAYNNTHQKNTASPLGPAATPRVPVMKP